MAVMWDAVPRICLSRASNRDTYISNRRQAITCASNVHNAEPFFIANMPQLGRKERDMIPNGAPGISTLSPGAQIVLKKRS